MSRRAWRRPSASSCCGVSWSPSARSWARSDRATRTSPTTTAAMAAERDLPEAVRKAVDREIDKLERMSEQNPEHGWIRTWLDTVLRVALGRAVRGPARCGRGVAHPRRGPRRPPRCEGPHPRAPGRAQAAGRARPGPGGGSGRGRHPGPGRSARAWARPPWASRWPAPSDARSSGWPWAGSATRPRSEAIAAPTWAPSPAGWCGPCARPAP